MVRRPTVLIAFLAIFGASGAATALPAVPVELRGSPASMQRQHLVAKQAEVPFARTFADIERLLEAGELVRLEGNAHYDLRDGLHVNIARPEMRLFVERLAAEYFVATGEKLVVTSLIRPSSAQPRNSHPLSIHPTGLALDLRVSQQAASRQWIERHLLAKEALGLLDVTREHHPPHYHLALFPDAYLAHVEAEIGAEALAVALGQAPLVEVTLEEEPIMAAVIDVEELVDSDRPSLIGRVLRFLAFWR